jgi:hypothetical protein
MKEQTSLVPATIVLVQKKEPACLVYNQIKSNLLLPSMARCILSINST